MAFPKISAQKPKKPKTIKPLKDTLPQKIGQNAIIHLRGNQILRGKIKKVTLYDITIETEQKEEILILKHAIDYIKWIKN